MRLRIGPVGFVARAAIINGGLLLGLTLIFRGCYFVQLSP